MANSIIGSSAPSASSSPQLLQQITEFKRNYSGDPKQAVMKMLQQGQITSPQLQQAMQMAKQIQQMFK